MTRILRWALGVVGVAVMVVAAVGIGADRRYTAPKGLLEWLAGSIVLSDFVIAPTVLLVGFLIVRLVPAVVRPAIVLGLMAAGTVVAVGIPIVMASHRPRANETILPLDYGRGLFLTLLGIALLTGLGAGWLVRRSGFGPRRQDASGSE